MPLTEEQSRELTESASLRMDDVEGVALRLFPFLEQEKEITGEMHLNSKILASVAFMANGELISNHYRKFGGPPVMKSRSASDLPVQPAGSFPDALALVDSAIDNVMRVNEALEALYEKNERVVGGPIGAEIEDLYTESINTRMSFITKIVCAMQHSLVLVNAGFDFEGISSAVKSAPTSDEDGPSGSYL